MTAAFVLLPEPRPRDFGARLRRSRAHGTGAARRQRTKARLGLALAGAVAIPAMAAPDDWAQFDIGSAGAAQVRVDPMPFEQAGSSFPGSAFYYLAPDPPPGTGTPGFGEGIHSDAGPIANHDPLGGPVARSMRIDNSGIDRTRALQCLTAAVYFEAASEPDSGQRAVAQVVLNRVAHPAYPDTVCGVVFQGSERRTGCQFSFTCDGALGRVPNRMFWLRAEAVAAAALGGYVHAPAGLATHYHTIHVNPYWAPKLNYLGTIGLHRFYSFHGRAGQAATFRFAYAGGEPAARPHPRSASPLDPVDAAVVDPVAVQRAYEEGLKAARASVIDNPQALQASQAGSAKPGAAPAYAQPLRDRGGDAIFSGEKLPEATGIREEYRNSGRWIGKPGT